MPGRTLRFLFLLLGLLLQPSLYAAPSNFTVVIDAGHGGKDPGTLGSSSKEKDIVLAIALKLGGLISARQPDVKIIYTRNTDEFIELNNRAIIANKAKADLFISIHADHAKSPTVKGPCTFTLGENRSAENMAIAKRENSVILLEDDYKQRYEGFDPTSAESYIMFEFMQDNYMDQSIRFASTVQDKFKEDGRLNRGVRQDVFLVLRCTSMPSVLIEVGFLSNPDEERYLKSSAGQEEVAGGIYRGFADFRADYERKSTTTSPLTKLSKDSAKEKAADKPDTTARKDTTRVRETMVKDSSEKIPEQKDDLPQIQTTQEVNANAAPEGTGIIFKVQLLVTDRPLNAGNNRLKKQPSEFYSEKGLYKYTAGAFRTFEEANQLRKNLSEDFPGCFVVAFKDGQKIAVEKARVEAGN